MSKETLSAEHYITQWCDETYKGGKEIGDWTTNEVMKFANDFADYKFKSKVNAITDEEIKKMFTTEHFSQSNGRYYRERVDRITGARMFKNRLLND